MSAGSYEKEAEVVVRRSLEFIILTALHPNTAISVILQVTLNANLKTIKSTLSMVGSGTFSKNGVYTFTRYGFREVHDFESEV